MMKKHYLFLSVLIASLFIINVTGIGRGSAAEITLKMAGSLPKPHAASQAVIRFVNEVKNHTKGRVQIDFYPGSSLYKDKDIPTAIPQGAVDLALTNFGTWSGVCPSLVALELVGGVYKDYKHYNKAEDGPLGKILADDLAMKGVHLIGFAALGESQTISTTKKQIQKPGDLKGLLIRAPTVGMQWFVESFGAVPTFVSSAELYSALQRGTVDGACSTAHSSRQSKWFEACSYITWVMMSPGAPFGIVANLNVWNKLPPDIRKIITSDWADELGRNRIEAHQQQVDAWKFLKSVKKITTYEVTDEVREKDWDPTAYAFQLEKLHKLLGKEKTDQLLKAIASTK
jgi:C4-dicarboxylate-binding protein DctP